MGEFRNQLAETVFRHKYANHRNKDFTWAELAHLLVDDVCGTFQGKEYPLLSKDELDYLEKIITEQKWIPGGRYLYYAGRQVHYWNNCFLLRAEEDTREEWSDLNFRATSALMSGGGIGIDYSILREEGRPLSRTGGIASGPLGLMNMINEVGRYVMQGGSRRSAIYASLNWQHPDAQKFLTAKNWDSSKVGNQLKLDGTPYTLWDAKQEDFNFHAPLDMTNISLNYDDEFLKYIETNNSFPETYLINIKQALSTAEPGFSFNFGNNQKATLRNACCEVVSEDDSDVCNLGSINLANIEALQEFSDIVYAATRFLLCGTLRASLPYEKVYTIREKNRRLGLGLMGIHEWLLKRGYSYEVVPELHKWLEVYKNVSDKTSKELANELGISRPVANRAIAPTGSIGILAGTTTGIEPLYAVSYKRRYLKGKRWHYQYVIDSTAEQLIQELGVDPEQIETAISLAEFPERRIKFQADIQDYVDMAISSTINLPVWGSKFNNEDRIESFAKLLYNYSKRIRGFTCYADGCRGGQPITTVSYKDAVNKKGVEHLEHDPCEMTGHGGICNV